MSKKKKLERLKEEKEQSTFSAPVSTKDPLKYLKPVSPKGPNQKKLVNLMRSKDIVIANGPAGTGKSFLALWEALNEYKRRDDINKIVLVKSVTVLQGEEIGFIKGTVDDKMSYHMCSFTGNINKLLNDDKAADKLKELGIIQWQPLAYIRGVNIDNAIVIIDEVQDITSENFKSIITRIGQSSKMIFLGDTEQIDLKKKSTSCLSKICQVFKDYNDVGVVEFTDADCLRNPIIPGILEKLRENGL